MPCSNDINLRRAHYTNRTVSVTIFRPFDIISCGHVFDSHGNQIYIQIDKKLFFSFSLIRLISSFIS
jgi:hypothetical protein